MTERSISDRLVSELCGIVRSHQAVLAIRITSYVEASWQSEEVKDRIGFEHLRELVEMVLESSEGLSSEIQGAVEIDAAIFTRGIQALRDADGEAGVA